MYIKAIQAIEPLLTKAKHGERKKIKKITKTGFAIKSCSIYSFSFVY